MDGMGAWPGKLSLALLADALNLQTSLKIANFLEHSYHKP